MNQLNQLTAKAIAQPPVIEQVDRLESLIHDLAGELSRLGEKLTPVLRPECDGKEAAEGCGRVASSPLAERLDDLGDKLQFRINIVRDLLNRVEV